jgi:hypothetical protein
MPMNENVPKKERDGKKPIGSGIFAVVCGAAFLVLFFLSQPGTGADFNADWTLRLWLLFVAACLILWGLSRILTGNKKDFRIGQDTASFVVSIVGVTIAIVAMERGPSPAEQQHAFREDCSRDARAEAKTFVTEFRMGRTGNWSTGMNAHYRSSDQHCYAELWMTSEPQAPLFDIFFNSYLIDIDENVAKGELRQEAGKDSALLECSVGGTKCSSLDQWNALVKLYMEDDHPGRGGKPAQAESGAKDPH